MKDRERPWVLGIGSSHNGAVCLLRGDELVVAIQEERLVREKRAWHPAGCASLAIAYCLDSAGIAAADLTAIGVCTRAHLGSLDDVYLNPQLRPAANDIRVTSISHHLGHAVAAFATSGFDSAAVLVVDGSGSPWLELSPGERDVVLPCQRTRVASEGSVCETASMYEAVDRSLRPIEKHVAARRAETAVGMTPFFSIGRLFENVGRQIFGERLDGPGKVMGLAPYGVPTIPIEDFFVIDGDEIAFRDDVPGRFRHNERWPLHQREYADLAASVQQAFEHALLWLVQRVRRRLSSPRLCYTGGVALNSIANERLIRESGFDDVFIMPAAEDSGTAIGAAYHALWQFAPRRDRRRQVHDTAGRVYMPAEIDAAIERHPAAPVCRTTADVIAEAAELLAHGSILGWFQGGSELGPRALGNRSILADPRDAEMKDRLNARVKFREPFRPYAPAVLLEHASDWFETRSAADESPFMLRVLQVRPEQRSRIPAVVHVDGTARVQTVSASHAPRLHALLTAFHRRTGIPILLNTSLNAAGDPIVETPDDALWLLHFTELDGLVLDTRLLIKPAVRSSPLDWTPVVTARWISTEYAVREGRITASLDASPPALLLSASEGLSATFGARADRHGIDYVRVVVEGRYGRVVHAAGTDLFQLLTHIDGRRTARDILERSRRRKPAWSEVSFLALFRRLASTGIIAFRQPSVVRGERGADAPEFSRAGTSRSTADFPPILR